MKIILLQFSIFFLFPLLNAQSTLPKVTHGKIIRIDTLHSAYVTSRTIDIWLPENYSEKTTYAVLYMHDGQMLFDADQTWNKQAWEIDEKAHSLSSTKEIKPFIVVGIWNGGQTRHADYFPQKPFDQLSAVEKDTVSAQLKRAGRVNSDFLPERAGAQTIKNFMLSSAKSNKVNITTQLMPNETVSGIIEGTFLKNDTLIFKFGKSDKYIGAFNIYQNKYDFDISYQLTTNNSVQHKLGERGDNFIPGQYGQNINITLLPKQTGIMKLSFSPRGGAGLLIFSHRGKIYSTKLMPARSNSNVIMISVEKDKAEKFTFIPVGGLNYPINLDFSLHNILLEESIA